MLHRSVHAKLRWASTGIGRQLSPGSRRQLFSAAGLDHAAKSEAWREHGLSRFWIPTGGVTSSLDGKQDDATALLVKAGFIRQAHSGIYHLLPLAQKLQNDLEGKLSWHLERYLGASKVSLSALSSEELWRRSGRIGEKPLSEVEHQFLMIRDRKDSNLILSPTHEEEITTLVANDAKSYKDFPLRLFQVGRKYRDELRPRHGLLRTKEFLMKDMYTFDISEEAAMETYNKVRQVYRMFFKRLGLPVVEAKASSGDMGGDLSHEFHILSKSGEDTLHICQSCGFAENEEVTSKAASTPIEDHSCPQCSSKTMTTHNAIEVGHTFHLGTRYSEPLNAMVEVPVAAPANQAVVQSEEAKADKSTNATKSQRVPLQMGCHGIGLSRLIGAAASHFADDKGIRWPLNMSPVGIMLIVDGDGSKTPGLQYVVNSLSHIKRSIGTGHFGLPVWVDDRGNKSLGWKLKDAELVGYPLTIVLGRTWTEKGEYEIKCRSNPSLDQSCRYLVKAVMATLNWLDPETFVDQKGRLNIWKTSEEAWNEEMKAARANPVKRAMIEAYRLEKLKTSDAEGGAEAQVRKGEEENLPTRKQTPDRKQSHEMHVRYIHTQITPKVRNAIRKQPTIMAATSKKASTPEDSWLPANLLNAKSESSKPPLARAGKKDHSRSKGSRSIPIDKHEEPAVSHSAGHSTLSREHLLEKVQLLERLFALQDKEKELELEQQNTPPANEAKSN